MIKQLVQIFLQINPEPSDDQVHNLAYALGIDKETLEAEMYEMLSDCVECTADRICAAHRLLSASEFEEVLTDELKPIEIRDSLMTVNDGETDDIHNQDIQDATESDGGLGFDESNLFSDQP